MTATASARYAPAHNDDELLAVVREVSAAAEPASPASASQRKFDEARGLAGHPGCPAARSIAARFGCSWRDLQAAAHGPEGHALRTVRQSASDKGRTGLTLDALEGAARQAAIHLGTKELTRDDYARAQAEITAGSARAWLHASGARMPTLAQADSLLRRERVSWEELCHRAGSAAGRNSRRGVSWAEAAERFATATGHVPRSDNQLVRFSKAQQFALSRRPGPRALAKAINAVQAGRADPLPRAPAGLELPAAEQTPDGAPPRVLKGRWTRELIIAGLAQAFEFLGPGEAMTRRTLKRIARDNPGRGIPSASIVERFAARTPGESWAGCIAEGRSQHLRSHAAEDPA